MIQIEAELASATTIESGVNRRSISAMMRSGRIGMADEVAIGAASWACCMRASRIAASSAGRAAARCERSRAAIAETTAARLARASPISRNAS